MIAQVWLFSYGDRRTLAGTTSGSHEQRQPDARLIRREDWA